MSVGTYNDAGALFKLGMRVSEFLAAFYPDRNEKINLIQFKPKQAPPYQETFMGRDGALRKREPACHSPRTYSLSRAEIEEDVLTLEELANNSLTRGTYFFPNSGGRTKDSITRRNAWFCENDELSIDEQFAALNAAPLQPSIMLVTKKSIHAYWLADEDCEPDEWTDIQQRLQQHFNSDPSLFNPNRMMRMPHFDHLTYTGPNAYQGDKADDFRFLEQAPELTDYERQPVVLVKFAPSVKYSLRQMQDAFEPLPVVEEITVNVEPRDFPNWVDELRYTFESKGRRKPKGYEMRCPVCGGSSSTTAFMYNDGGFKCHKSNCKAKDMAQALGIEIQINNRGIAP